MPQAGSQFKGLGSIPKKIFKKGLKKSRRNSKFPTNGLSDEALEQLIKSGIRVYDKKRGIYTHV